MMQIKLIECEMEKRRRSNYLNYCRWRQHQLFLPIQRKDFKMVNNVSLLLILFISRYLPMLVLY